MSNTQVAARNGEEPPVAGSGDDPGTGLAIQTSLAVSLARAEVDQQVATARALPRSVQRAVNQIVTLATLDEESAAECIYALPRAGKTIRGPSIRLAEIAATSWGNCRVGARVVHVDRLEQFVEAEGVFQDLETNVIQTARVRGQIHAKRGKGIDNDMVQLAGARACSIARRNAILAGIPRGVTRRGYTAVEDLLRGDIKTLGERRASAIKAFGVLGVTPDRLFAGLGVQGEDDITLDHLLTLTGTRAAIKNGEMTIEEAFPPPAKPGDRPKDLAAAIDKLAGADPETGEIKESGDEAAKASVMNTRAEMTSDNVRKAAEAAKETETANNSVASAAASQGPQEGAGQGTPLTSSPAPTDQPHDALADLLATGDGRAEGGEKPLQDFLSKLRLRDRNKIPPERMTAWLKTAKAVDARRGQG